MKLLNYRLNFATNSSSSHSVLALDLNASEDSRIKADDCEIGSYGWEYFTAASQEAKMMYLCACVYAAYYNMDSSEDSEYAVTHQRALKKTAVVFPEYKEQILNSGSLSVDHQSLLLIPQNYEQTDLNIEYIEELKKYFSNPKILIAGGNDNDDQDHYLLTSGIYKKAQIENLPKETSNYIARRGYVVLEDGSIDYNQSYWSLFSRDSGTKFRITFDESIHEVPKSSAPELADICLTSYCTFGCEYCYQDSDQKGSHAKLEDIEYIAKQLSQAQVFECACGGGEPTLHPDFAKIVDIFHKNKIKMNFTTKNLAFFKKEENRALLPKIGAFAFSVQSSADVLKLKTLIDLYPQIQSQASVQYVMGSSSIEDFEQFLITCADSSIRPTLLGYKTVGRGDSFTPHDYSQWLEVVKRVNDSRYLNLSIDTQLAAQSKKKMKSLGIPDYTFHTTEGTHSIYVDAVKKTISPSSYIGLEQTVAMDDNWLKEYLKMRVDAAAEVQKENGSKRKIRIKNV